MQPSYGGREERPLSSNLVGLARYRQRATSRYADSIGLPPLTGMRVWGPKSRLGDKGRGLVETALVFGGWRIELQGTVSPEIRQILQRPESKIRTISLTPRHQWGGGGFVSSMYSAGAPNGEVRLAGANIAHEATSQRGVYAESAMDLASHVISP